MNLPASDAATNAPKGSSQVSSESALVWRWTQPLVAAVLMTLAFLTIPPVGTDIGINGDISLGAVLNHAHEHGFQFGPDVVFTYGPLGFLVFFYYWPHLLGLRMAVDLALCFTVALGLCLVAWRLRAWWRWPLLACLVFAAANLEPRLDLVLETGLFCWGLLCLVESGRRLAVYVSIFAALAAFSALAKTSFLFLGGLSIALIACDLALRRKFLLAAALLPAFGACFVAGWLAAGQNLFNLGSFLLNSLLVVRGYNQALAWEGLSGVRHIGFVLLALAALVVALQTLTAFEPGNRTVGWRRLTIFAWMGSLTFAFWKHGFVREDFRHPAFFMSFLPVLVMALEIIPPGSLRVRWYARGAALVACFTSLLALQSLYFPPVLRAVEQPFRVIRYSLQCLFWPGDYHRRMSETLETCRREAALPKFRSIIGDDTVDCFGYCQVYLLLNGLNYHPAPVFQSYVACTAPLMGLNEQFYLSKSAPKYVVFALNAVDRKFPCLEDGRVLRDLLLNYELVAAEGDFLLLRARSSGAPRLTLLKEGSALAGQPIDLRPYASPDLWIEIELKPSWLGRLREFLFRAPTVRLAAWREPGKGLLLRRRAPAAGLEAGFVASPLLSRTADVLNLYTTNSPTRPGAYTVEPTPGSEHSWQQPFRFRIYQIDERLGRLGSPGL